MPDRPLVVNATAIGCHVDGIAVYGVNLVRALWRAGVARPFTVVLNECARRFFPESEIPAGASIQWVSERMSPYGTPGNMRRWLYANHLARRRRDSLVFGLSQLEAPIVGGRNIVMVHDMIPWLFQTAHPRQYYFYRHCLGRAVNHALAVVTPSQATKDDVCRYYGIRNDRVHVIRHGSPVPLSQGPTSDKGYSYRYILWIGRADPTKNLPALLAAFQTIERQLDVRLVIAGEGPHVDLTAARVEGGSLDRVTVLGPVSEAEKIALLDRASVLVSPSLYEGFGFAPLEAMARGCPVVTSHAGGQPEVCGDAAVYVDPKHPQQIADALVHVLTHPDFARDLVDRGRARTGTFTWEASVRAHLAVFDHVARLDRMGRSDSATARDGRIEADVLL